MLNFTGDPIVETILFTDSDLAEAISSAERDMAETASSANEHITELQAAQEALENVLTIIDKELSEEEKCWQENPLFRLCRTYIPRVKEKYDQLDLRRKELENLKWQISSDALDKERQTLEETLRQKRQSLSRILRQKIQFLAFRSNECQTQSADNYHFDESFLNSVSKENPSGIVTGKWKLTFQEKIIGEEFTFPLPGEPDCIFPHIIKFPFDRPFYGKMSGDDAVVRLLLLRLLFALPVGAVELTVIDPLNLGRSFLSFMPFRSIERFVQDNWCLTRSQDIESALSDLCNYLESLMQEKQVAYWSRYDKNRKPIKDENGNEISPLPYKLVLIYGFPEQFSDNSITYLKRILEIGQPLGVLPIILLDSLYNDLLERLCSIGNTYIGSLLSNKFGETAEHFAKFAQNMEEVKRYCGKSADILVTLYQRASSITAGNFPKPLRRLKCETITEKEPKAEDFDRYVGWISKAYRERQNFVKDIKKDMWECVKPGFTKNKEGKLEPSSTSNGLSVPVGWNVEGKEVEIRFEDAVSHAFIGGISGGGKSNLLHVIIHNLIHKYSADELNVYLLDYKGTEFQYYTGIETKTGKREFEIPQIKLVTQMMNREDGVMILDHLVKINDERMAEFNEAGVNGISEYRKKTGGKMPRIVVIVDEFHTMFEERDKLADKSSLALEKLLRKGRSQGIHVLLATQTLKGLLEFIMKFKEQLVCRIALRCGEEDSPAILGNSHNYAASKLPVRTGNEAREGILNESGSVLDNKRFSIPYADPGKTGKEHLQKIWRYAEQQGLSADMKIINGQELPLLTEEVFSKIELTAPQMILGEELNYEAEPFKFNWNRSNLCIAVPAEGESLLVRQAILRSLLTCVKQHNMFENIIYYKADEANRFDISDSQEIELQDHTWNGDISGLIADFKTKRSLLIIDTLEAAEMFHPPKQTFGIKKEETAEPVPAEMLKKLLDEGPKNGSFVIAFVENWKLFSDIYKNYLDLFGFRVGFGLNEKDAGGLVNDTMSPSIKDKGFVNGTKAVFVDTKRGKTALFRPFIVIQ